jgi:succinyl-diaminopimelate desuccinylase
MDVIGLAKSLIDQDTTIPPGNEKKAARVLQDTIQDLHIADCSVELDEFEPGRANLVVKIGPDAPGLILSGHIDVVPAGDVKKWKSPPFQGEVRSGRLFGRGSVDMKGAVAAMVVAISATKGSKLKRKLVFAATAGEEITCDGLESLIRSRKIVKKDALYSVIGEPTLLRPVRAHRGASTFEVRFMGRNAHASKPELGANAVEACADFIVGVESWREHFKKEKDEELGITIVSNTTISGGSKSNIIPDSCEVAIDCRWIPRHNHAVISKGLKEIAEKATREVKGTSFKMHTVLTMGALLMPKNHPLVRLAEGVSGRESTIATYGTEGPIYLDAGIPSVILGPGNIDVAHTPNEYVEVRQVEKAVETYSELIRKVCL